MIQISNPSANFKTAQPHSKIDLYASYFAFKQHKQLNTIAVVIDNAVKTGAWVPYSGAFRPKIAKNSEPNTNYSTLPSLYEGLLTPTTGFQSTSAGSTATVQTNFLIDDNRFSRVSATTTTAGATIQIQFYSDIASTVLVGNATAILPNTNEKNYILFNSILSGTQAVTGNGISVIGATVTTPIPLGTFVRAIRYTAGSGAAVIEHQNANNSESFTGVKYAFNLSCSSSTESERNLETADQLCENLVDGTTATGDGLRMTFVVNSYSLKLLALTHGRMIETKQRSVVSKLGDYELVVGTLGSLTVATAIVGAGLDLSLVRVTDKIFGSQVYQIDSLEFDNYIYDNVAGIVYVNIENAGSQLSISTKQNKLANVFDMKALELGYLMEGQIGIINESGQTLLRKLPKTQIVEATMNAEDSNHTLEIVVAVYPDGNKSFGEYMQY